jgi:hypothetical protein
MPTGLFVKDHHGYDSTVERKRKGSKHEPIAEGNKYQYVFHGHLRN